MSPYNLFQALNSAVSSYKTHGIMDCFQCDIHRWLVFGLKSATALVKKQLPTYETYHKGSYILNLN